MLPPSLSPRRSALKAPKIAYDQYIKIKRYDTSDLTAKQINLLDMIKEEKEVLKRDISQVSILNKLLEKDLVEIIKKEKRRLVLPDDINEKQIKTKLSLNLIIVTILHTF